MTTLWSPSDWTHTFSSPVRRDVGASGHLPANGDTGALEADRRLALLASKLATWRRRGMLAALVAMACLTAPTSAAATHQPVTATPRPDAAERRTSHYLNSIRSEPAAVRQFMVALPKGGDLHNHLSGAATTETLISLAIADKLCIDTTTMTALAAPPAGASCPAGQRPATDASTDQAFYEQLLRAWSMEGFQPGVEGSGHDHFFATFGRIGEASSRRGDLLASVATLYRAENVQYLETLTSRQGGALRALAERVGFKRDFGELRRAMLEAGMADIVAAARADTDADQTRFNELLRCRMPRPQPGCALDVRYDYQVARAQDPAVVFANILLGFELQNVDPRYVGLNLVQAEDHPIALRDYTLHMEMIGFLRGLYPRAHVTLHAGELAPGLAAPGDLRFHIRQAVEIARAERIGHGVDLVYETQHRQLLTTMARRHVLVEVPLTSNEQILGVSGRQHPFNRYRRARVPVALATDDPGVSRIDFSHEFELAFDTYHLRYRDLKRLARTSLEHAFLPGRSIWRARDDFRLVNACAADVPGSGRTSRRCRRFINDSAKAALQWRHEVALRRFERRWAAPGRAESER